MAQAWLAQSQPFFAWVHYFDPHLPYSSPLALLPEFSGRPYDAEIAFVDQELKRLLENLTSHGEIDRTVVIVPDDLVTLGRVVTALDIAKASGAESLALLNRIGG